MKMDYEKLILWLVAHAKGGWMIRGMGQQLMPGAVDDPSDAFFVRVDNVLEKAIFNQLFIAGHFNKPADDA